MLACHLSRARDSYAELDWGSVTKVEAGVTHRFRKSNKHPRQIFPSFELNDPVPGLAGQSFTLEEVPKLQIDIQTKEGKIEIGKEFRFVAIFQG